ncbi:anti-phage ATPase IteA [Comamonas thiooxydans]|uniref:anti-phage ATPase IteA n=1 Tax=Comamonas thiooxydans TaxID=363952 RepID=UPI00054F5340|nr:anti-phage ATPase IteA [Comamonas thiooxydans]
MEHLSEILKILDGALKSNQTMATNYAGLLADKLERDGSRREAAAIRERLARVPAALVAAQRGTHGDLLGNLPVDGDSRLNTVDVSRPVRGDIQVLLPSGLQARIQDFLSAIHHRDKLLAAGVSQPNRLIMHGPPGTGKTQTARWIAGELQLPLLTVRCDTLISSLLGQTSRNLRRVFDYAQEVPCVLFLDEFDALGTARGNERDVGELQRVVIALLQNIDALPEETILLAATNHDQLLDYAIWRRFTYRLAIPLPDSELRQRLWTQFIGANALSASSFKELAERSDGLSGAAIQQVSLDAKRSAILSGSSNIEEIEVFRRLGLTVAMSKEIRLHSVQSEMQWLRRWYPKFFSQRVLAAAYGISLRQVRNTLDEKGGDGDRGDQST